MTPPFPLGASHERIRRLSAWVRGLCALAALTVLLLPPYFWSQPEWVASVIRAQMDLPLMQLDGASRLAALAGASVQSVVGLWAMWEIWHLFGCFQRGEVLALQPTRHLHRLGLAVASLAAAMPLSNTLTALALTWHNPPGKRQLVINFSGHDYMALLFGLVLLALATVLREAAQVAQENAEFI